ncbi:MAG: UvrD-helicase domain-containing protein, partial [Armatimonadetes bacterium]|nr:UvrD-helicase domain-containing protein [Armatimonadota bacterium]
MGATTMAAEKSSPELLPDQAAREAAQTCLDVSFLLEAGAGSGKTRALVDRYLSILDNDEQADVENIVAITFTRKAAREMKERIRAELVARMATAGDDDLRRLRERIRKLETAPICTIHSFCASILEQYPFAAELDPRFTLLDETQTDVNLPRVVEDSLLSRLSSDSEQDSNTAARVISYFGGLPKAGDAIVELLYKRSQYYDYLCAPPSAEEIGRSWEERERQFYGPIREQFVSELRAQDLVSRISAAAEIARAIPDSDHLAKQVLRVHYLLQDGPPLHSDGLADFRTEILNATKNINMGRQDNWGGREKIEQARRAMAAVRELAQNLLGELNTLATQYSEETVEVAAAIWAEAAAALQAWRDFEATIPALDFEDVQIRLRDLLRSNAEVRRALQARFRHILVDEFQDTDGLQRDLVWLLAGLQQDGEGSGRVFVVGDAKQSIYRFRNADVKVFTDACRQFEEDSGARRERLTATFRAHSGLVD